jgi:hypothetical protein
MRFRPKLWFQAQCAHYGLSTQGTLAMLRAQLEKSLASFRTRMQERSERLEKERAGLERKSRKMVQKPAQKVQMAAIQSTVNITSTAEPESFHNGARILQSDAVSGVCKSNAAEIFIPPPKDLPTTVSFVKSVQWDPEIEALDKIKLRMKLQEPNSSGTDTESDSENSISASESRAVFPPPGLPSPLYHLPSLQPRTNRAQAPRMEEDVVSGRWALQVTCHTMRPLPTPWRTASSSWLRGDMNVHLAPDRRSLTAEFALLGLDGVIKSRKFEPRGKGVCAWVRFVAQMPITTAEEPGAMGTEHNCMFGPSEMQYGYLRFHGDGRIKGMLRCRRYGRLEFEGVRVGEPKLMCAKWGNFA